RTRTSVKAGAIRRGTRLRDIYPWTRILISKYERRYVRRPLRKADDKCTTSSKIPTSGMHRM
ncbi:MAG TPA: hypothetical protein VEC08_02035, partial [Nitrososphaerales archaeon]|nr:hypothetical protein [Nitrososphaerales archaeon]